MKEPMIAVASPERCFADDLAGLCARCGQVVYYRPHTPIPDERICAPCFFKAPPADMRLLVTGETLRELALLAAAKGRPQ